MKENLLLKKILLKIFNRISADNNYLKIESIHFKNNYLRIEGNENSLQCEKQSFLRNSHVYIKGMENRISIDIETEVYGNNMQVLFVNGSNNQILIGKNCVIRDTTFFINGKISNKKGRYHLPLNRYRHSGKQSYPGVGITMSRCV